MKPAIKVTSKCGIKAKTRRNIPLQKETWKPSLCHYEISDKNSLLAGGLDVLIFSVMHAFKVADFLSKHKFSHGSSTQKLRKY